MVDWNPYLNSLCNAYTQWWKFGTLKDVVEPKQVESEPSTLPFEFGLMVQTVEQNTQQWSKEEQKIERLSVLEGLRKYAPNHVLLVGRPGSGKSTALVRLLVATAQQALQNPHSQIPVLVELRTYKIYYKTSVLDLVQASLKRRRLRLNIETLEDLLAEGRFLLLMDGINELPNDEAWTTIKAFRLDYSDVPMVFTTRDLSLRGDLGIETKLEMQSLTETEVEKFVRECMPGGSQQTLQQLRQRLRELGQTPFVMWMLYFIVQKTGTVPSGAGSAFREFTQLYERSSKDDAPVSDESRRWWSRLLEHLGFEMMQAETPTDLRLTISKREAEDILTKVLDSEKFDKPRDYALRWLEDLLKHHLIQVTSNDQIEFCHQLIQEYYAAECLLQMLLQEPSPLSDETLKREYLNYLKWTEPLALMLELVEDEAQAVQVVKLALEVDWQLGARLAGAVKPEWQEQTVDLVAGLEIPQLVKVWLLGLTKSERAIPILDKLLEDENSKVRLQSVVALEKIGGFKTIPSLSKALEGNDYFVLLKAAATLGKFDCAEAHQSLSKSIEDKRFSVYFQAVVASEENESCQVVHRLIQAVRSADSYTWSRALVALGRAIEEAVALGRSIRQQPNYNFSRAGEYKSFLALLKTAVFLVEVGADEEAICCLSEGMKDESLIADTNITTLDYATAILRASQNRCGFYNYTIGVSPPPQKDSKLESLTVSIDMQQYEEILSVISNMVTVMERNPKTFKGIEEEALRDHFLVQLNGKCKGQATGETFNKKGKTDILIRVEGKNIFIAECKFWGGEKKLKETLDQLLGYTTWRDTKLALLIFNRNKNFSAVLEQISEVMKNHPTFTRELSYPSETAFRFILHHPEDKNRELLLTVLAFEIPRSH